MKFMSNVVSFSKVNKFEEIKDELYGEIDVENAKKILAIDPLSSGLTDGKITTSDLVEDMVLLSHLGNPDGSTWVPTQNFRNKYSLANVFPAMGWVEIDPTEIVPQSVQPSDSIDDIVPENKEDEINFESIITLFILGILFLTLLILYFKYLKRGNKK